MLKKTPAMAKIDLERMQEKRKRQTKSSNGSRFGVVYQRRNKMIEYFQKKYDKEAQKKHKVQLKPNGSRFGIVYQRRKKMIEYFQQQYDNEAQKKDKVQLKLKVDFEVRQCEENEMKWFHRVKSFISNMHLIQGDRKFSQWKGSVMDSIGGAYLTQNVNDTHSSSAFMMLAAKYPCSTTTKNVHYSSKLVEAKEETISRPIKRSNKSKKDEAKNWDELKTLYYNTDNIKKCDYDTSSALDWDAVCAAQVEEIAKTIENRGMNYNLATRIKNCLTIFDKQLGSVDMEWMRDVPPKIAKEYLLSISGLGVKSVECISLLTLQHKAFPIDTNAGRVAVRLGWVPLQPLPQGHEFHLLKVYPHVDVIQTYLWPKLSQMDQSLLYELHCHMITCGKVFCTKVKPNCNACPMNAECKYNASALASAQQKRHLMDIEGIEDKTRRVRVVKKKREKNIRVEQGEMLIPLPKLKNINHSRTEHQVYVILDRSRLLDELQLEKREPSDPCHYLLAIWTSGNDIVEKDIIRGTLMIPIRTAMRGTFPLNGTYFQVNEVLADAESSEIPIKVHSAQISHLSRKTLYCGYNISSICRGMKGDEVKKCFSEGYVCFRGFDRKTREPKPLLPRFHGKLK